jgi:anti-sigma B factor antagonist
MSVTVHPADPGDGARVVELAGDVDLYAAPELKRELMGLIDAGATRLVVDLTETTFIDSAALGLLAEALKRLQPIGGRIVLVCSDRTIRKAFEITWLDRVFAIAATRAEALLRLQPAGEPA